VFSYVASAFLCFTHSGMYLESLLCFRARHMPEDVSSWLNTSHHSSHVTEWAPALLRTRQPCCQHTACMRFYQHLEPLKCGVPARPTASCNAAAGGRERKLNATVVHTFATAFSLGCESAVYI
jgi:hypothetical protein